MTTFCLINTSAAPGRRSNIATFDLNALPPTSDEASINYKRFTNLERRRIANIMFLNFNNNKLKHGLIKKLACENSVSRITIWKIWKVVLKPIKDGVPPDLTRKYKGGKKKYGIDLEQVKLIPLHLRTNIRTLAAQLHAPSSTVHRLIQRGKIRSHSNALKPYLTDSNMEARVEFVMKHIEYPTLHINPTYEDMYYVVHIDEKWFYMTRNSQRYYLLPNELEPHRTCKSKNFTTKVMFMSAISRPRYDQSGNCIFDGKIGIFPFTIAEPAKRASKNRARGVMEIKPIESITKL